MNGNCIHFFLSPPHLLSLSSPSTHPSNCFLFADIFFLLDGRTSDSNRAVTLIFFLFFNSRTTTELAHNSRPVLLTQWKSVDRPAARQRAPCEPYRRSSAEVRGETRAKADLTAAEFAKGEKNLFARMSLGKPLARRGEL